jgi:hypothetical protein
LCSAVSNYLSHFPEGLVESHVFIDALIAGSPENSSSIYLLIYPLETARSRNFRWANVVEYINRRCASTKFEPCARSSILKVSMAMKTYLENREASENASEDWAKAGRMERNDKRLARRRRY